MKQKKTQYLFNICQNLSYHYLDIENKDMSILIEENKIDKDCGIQSKVHFLHHVLCMPIVGQKVD